MSIWKGKIKPKNGARSVARHGSKLTNLLYSVVSGSESLSIKGLNIPAVNGDCWEQGGRKDSKNASTDKGPTTKGCISAARRQRIAPLSKCLGAYLLIVVLRVCIGVHNGDEVVVNVADIQSIM